MPSPWKVCLSFQPKDKPPTCYNTEESQHFDDSSVNSELRVPKTKPRHNHHTKNFPQSSRTTEGNETVQMIYSSSEKPNSPFRVIDKNDEVEQRNVRYDSPPSRVKETGTDERGKQRRPSPTSGCNSRHIKNHPEHFSSVEPKHEKEHGEGIQCLSCGKFLTTLEIAQTPVYPSTDNSDKKVRKRSKKPTLETESSSEESSSSSSIFEPKSHTKRENRPKQHKSRKTSRETGYASKTTKHVERTKSDDSDLRYKPGAVSSLDTSENEKVYNINNPAVLRVRVMKNRVPFEEVAMISKYESEDDLSDEREERRRRRKSKKSHRPRAAGYSSETLYSEWSSDSSDSDSTQRHRSKKRKGRGGKSRGASTTSEDEPSGCNCSPDMLEEFERRVNKLEQNPGSRKENNYDSQNQLSSTKCNCDPNEFQNLDRRIKALEGSEMESDDDDSEPRKKSRKKRKKCKKKSKSPKNEKEKKSKRKKSKCPSGSDRKCECGDRLTILRERLQRLECKPSQTTADTSVQREDPEKCNCVTALVLELQEKLNKLKTYEGCRHVVKAEVPVVQEDAQKPKEEENEKKIVCECDHILLSQIKSRCQCISQDKQGGKSLAAEVEYLKTMLEKQQKGQTPEQTAPVDTNRGTSKQNNNNKSNNSKR